MKKHYAPRKYELPPKQTPKMNFLDSATTNLKLRCCVAYFYSRVSIFRNGLRERYGTSQSAGISPMGSERDTKRPSSPSALPRLNRNPRVKGVGIVKTNESALKPLNAVFIVQNSTQKRFLGVIANRRFTIGVEILRTSLFLGIPSRGGRYLLEPSSTCSRFDSFDPTDSLLGFV